MSICTIYLKIKDEPIFPRTEERLRLQARELADYLGIGELEFDHRKDTYTFGWHAISVLDDIKTVITYPDALEEDDNWNEIVPNDKYNLYVVFRHIAKYDYYNHEKDQKNFCLRIRNLLKQKLPPTYFITSKVKGYFNENFMNED